MSTKWTKAQEAAINTHGKTILVSAAAGSGKTATLTERIIRSLTEENGLDISRMLIVTYTRAAAAELKVKQDKAKAFAEKQGLNVEDENVAQAIAEVNYEMIAELAMAETTNEAEEEKKTIEITMASYVDMSLPNDEYGGLLKRPNR